MSFRDIVPWKSPLGGHTEIHYGPMETGEVFDEGEPVNIDTTGEVEEPPDDVDSWKLADGNTAHAVAFGIAAWGPAGGAQTNDRYVGVGQINPKTGVVYAAGDEIGFYPANKGIKFITENFWATGGGSAATPAQTDVGISYMITYATFGTPDAGWGIEQTAAVDGTDVEAHVIDVLDTNYNPIRITGGTGVYVVFEIQAGT